VIRPVLPERRGLEACLGRAVGWAGLGRASVCHGWQYFEELVVRDLAQRYLLSWRPALFLQRWQAHWVLPVCLLLRVLVKR